MGLFPSEQEQISFIDQAERVEPTPFAFSFAQEDIDDVLRLASNTPDSRMVVAAAFQEQKSTAEIAALLQKQYHGGAGLKSENGELSVWYAEDGIHLAKGRSAQYKTTAQVISWETAAERIGQLMENGNFVTNVELAEAYGHERKQLAQSLWYLSRDFSNTGKEQGLLPTLNDYHLGGFPDNTERLAENLNDPAFRKQLTTEYADFLEAYKQDRSVMRFYYHKFSQIGMKLNDIDLPRKEFTTDMAEIKQVGMFITDDEIDATLSRGSSVEGGKGRIYKYLTESHNSKEKATFLKDEFGLSGSSHAVSGRGWREASGKGIKLQKPDCADVELNWNKVLERYENLIRNGRYFTPEEKAEYEEMQTAEWKISQSYNSYNDIKQEHPDDIVLFQVGDFFEMYGEDAKAAVKLLDLHLTTRPIAGAGRVEMCGVPAHALEQYVEKLRATNSVTIAAVNSVINEHTTYSLGVLGADKELPHEVETEPVSVTEPTVEAPVIVHREITQADIDEALRRWNGNMDSKRAVVRYMADHARERDTAAWLATEYGTDSSKPLHITIPNTDIDHEMSWAKVQRRIAQLIKTDSFFTEQEKEAFEDIDPVTIRENLAQRGIVNGEVVDPEKLDADPFIQRVMADAEQIAAENDRFHVVEVDRSFQTAYAIWDDTTGNYYVDEDGVTEEFTSEWQANDYLRELQNPATAKEQSVVATEKVEPFQVGDTVYLDNTAFEITEVGRFDVQLRDPTLLYPIFRAESKERLMHLLSLDERNSDILSRAETKPSYTTETVAVYPAEENNMPFDVVIQTLRTEEPEPPVPDIDEHPISVQINGEWQTFPNTAAAEEAMYEDYKAATHRNTQNFHITDDELGTGGAKAKFRANMNAIKLLKELEFEGAQATPEQQEVLSRYVGWGGLADAFDESKENWKDEFVELYETLSPEEYTAARASTLNAHYTSPTVIKAIYEALGNMGFETGNILEIIIPSLIQGYEKLKGTPLQGMLAFAG